MIVTDPQKIDALLTRGVSEVIGLANLRERLLAGEELHVKLGIDPTSPHLHLGRAVALFKLKDFQDLGHKVTFLVGNATGVIGDTSDKEAERRMLTEEETTANMQAYKDQAGVILDIEKVNIVYNADWLNTLGYAEIGHHADAFSLHDFMMRDNIKRRIDAGKRVSLRELLYPLMQGYDSVALESDVELGGSDQRFNLLAGRVLQEQAGQRPQDIVMGNLIDGTDGRKMSSSWGNTISLTEDAASIGEKVMNMPDESVPIYFEHCTRVPQEEIERVLADPDARQRKIHLAGAITTFIQGPDAAQELVTHLHAKYIEKNLDAQVDVEIPVSVDADILTVLITTDGVKSKGDARRKIEQGGVTLNGEKVTDVNYIFSLDDDKKIIKVGKKFFAKITMQ